MPEFSWNKRPVPFHPCGLPGMALLQSVHGKIRLFPKELGGYGPRVAEAVRPADGSTEPFQPEPEWHCERRPCPVRP